MQGLGVKSSGVWEQLMLIGTGLCFLNLPCLRKFFGMPDETALGS